LAPLICFEDTIPQQVRLAAALQPDLLVNITNDGWFQNSPGAEHHLINAVVRAVETDLPMLRCANTGITAAISPLGVIQAELRSGGRAVGVEGVLSQTLEWSPHHDTPYQRLGNWVVWLAMVITLRLRAKEIVRGWNWLQRRLGIKALNKKHHG
jgi:apolipoprotein N-acyltransferase